MNTQTLKTQARRLPTVIIGLALALCGLPLRGAPPTPLKAPTWIVIWEEGVCVLIRAGSDSPLSLKVIQPPLSNRVSVSMGNKTWRADPSLGAKDVDIVLLPSGEKVSGPSRFHRVTDGTMLVVTDIDGTFLARLSASRGIAMESNGTRLIEMTFPIANQAVEQFRRCGDDLLVEWGIDGKALAALKHRAVATTDPSKFMTAQDYPEAALRNKIKGTVVARYDITEDGKVTNCVAVNKGVKPILARATCQILEKHQTYQAAIGSDGKPAATQGITVLHYRLP